MWRVARLGGYLMLLPAVLAAQERARPAASTFCMKPRPGTACSWVWISELEFSFGTYEPYDWYHGVLQGNQGTNPALRYDLGVLRNLGRADGVGGGIALRFHTAREVFDVGLSGRYRHWFGEAWTLDAVGSISFAYPVEPWQAELGSQVGGEMSFAYKGLFGLGLGVEQWTETYHQQLPTSCTPTGCVGDDVTVRIVSPFVTAKLGSYFGGGAALLAALGAGVFALAMLIGMGLSS